MTTLEGLVPTTGAGFVLLVVCGTLACWYGLETVAVLAEGWPSGSVNKHSSLEQCTWLRSLGASQSYGLFAQITSQRNEIVIFEKHHASGHAPQHAEHSGGGKHAAAEWCELRFAYKPGPLDRTPPRLPSLHMPRLDWLLWLEAIRVGSPASLELQRQLGVGPMAAAHEWFRELLRRLREREEAVVALLEPTRDLREVLARPPLETRVALYEYAFSCPGVGREGQDWEVGQWWSRRCVMDIL